MNHLSETKNQHFISQTELRLNSINPLIDNKNQRIYCFELDDRESFSVKLISKKGVRINRSLFLNDLFSFDIPGDTKCRHNFERLFNKYEKTIRTETVSLLEKLDSNNNNIKPEIINLFISKFLNFIRNPYSIKKVLNTFPSIKRFKPLNKPEKSNFEILLRGRKPQMDYICSILDISKSDYVTWLSAMFMLLSEFSPNQPNFMEGIIRSLYENPNNVVSVMIYTYKNEICVLSDRGYTIPIPDGPHMAFDFNLNSNSFIRYMFCNLKDLMPPNIPENIIDIYKDTPKEVKVFHYRDEMSELELYNRNRLYQCYQRIYSSSVEIYGL